MFAANGDSPLAALTKAYELSSPAFSICKEDGEVVGMFGVAPDRNSKEVGYVWMLAADGLLDIKFTFLRQCRAWRDLMNAQYPMLTNVVDARNEVHIKWLEWMEFEFINTHEQYGHEGRKFHEFVRVR